MIKILKYFLLLSISGVLLYFAFRGVDVKKVMEGIFNANPFWVILSGLISIAAFIVRAYRWNLLIEPLDYSPSLKNSTAALMIGYLANIAVPRLGEVSRCGVLSKSESIPFNKLLGTVIVERVVDVISLFACLLLVSIIEYKRLGNFFKEKMIVPMFEKLDLITNSPLALGGLVFIIVVLAIGAIWLYKKTKKNKDESRIMKMIKGFIEGLRSVGKLKRPGLFVFHSVLIWFLYFLGVYVALFSLTSTSGLGMNAGLFLLVAGGFGMSAPVQGGIGAYHYLVSQGLILFGLSELDGLTFATMIHGLQVLLIIIMSIISFFLLIPANKNVMDAKSNS